jgi:hypothetical protein
MGAKGQRRHDGIGLKGVHSPPNATTASANAVDAEEGVQSGSAEGHEPDEAHPADRSTDLALGVDRMQGGHHREGDPDESGDDRSNVGEDTQAALRIR